MTKTTISATIDAEVAEYHRAKGTNVSQSINDYLKALMGESVGQSKNFGKLIIGLEADLAKMRMEQKQHEQVFKAKAEEDNKEVFRSEIMSLVEWNKKRLTSKHAQKMYHEGMQRVKDRHGLHMADVLAYVEGRKALP